MMLLLAGLCQKLSWLTASKRFRRSTALIIGRATLGIAAASAIAAIAAGFLSQSHKPLGIIVVGGLALLVRGSLLSTNYRGFLDVLAAGEHETWRAKVGFMRETRLGGLVLLLIGSVWTAIGISGIITLTS